MAKGYSHPNQFMHLQDVQPADNMYPVVPHPEQDQAAPAACITGQSPIRTGLTKVGLPGADIGLRAEDPSVAELLKPLEYATGQFGRNHLGDKHEFLPPIMASTNSWATSTT
jgi:hypothetical protein